MIGDQCEYKYQYNCFGPAHSVSIPVSGRIPQISLDYSRLYKGESKFNQKHLSKKSVGACAIKEMLQAPAYQDWQAV